MKGFMSVPVSDPSNTKISNNQTENPFATITGMTTFFDNVDAVDFIIYTELEKQEQELKDGKGGCFGGFALMLLAPISAVFIGWKLLG